MAAARRTDGALVVVEGVDGAGKTTVAQRLVEHLRADGHEVHATREPTDSFRGEAIRRALADPDHDPVSEALLFAADHAAHVAELRRHLAHGELVVSDRYSTSWRVYQSITLQEAWPEDRQPEPSTWLQRVVAPFELTPDRVLVLDVPVEEALDRLRARADDAEKFEKGCFLEQVRARYRELAEGDPYVLVDASGSIDATVDACLEALAPVQGGAD
jgi:dTMP kinase